jgi:hypothetical protein
VKDRKSPPSLDKQPVRDWCKSVGFGGRNPENVDDQTWVATQRMPAALVASTVKDYLDIFKILTGMELGEFQESVMNIPAH